MSSDNVTLLSYTTNIIAATTIFTDKVILGQYISLNIIPKADQDLTIVIQFSGDGSNWDYSVTSTVSAGSNTVISNPVQGKWMRLSITNSSAFVTTYLRVFVYGTPSNSSVTAQIGKIGNIWPSVNIDNLPFSTYGDLRTSESRSVLNYQFSRGTSGNINPVNYVIPYSDIVVAAPGGSITPHISYINGFMGPYGTTLGANVMVQSTRYKYLAGQGFTARFSGIFAQGSKYAANPAPTTELLGVGNGDVSTATVSNFLGFGFINTGIVSQDYFGIIYIRSGVRTFIPHTAWNIDKADGTNILPIVDFYKAQSYQINCQYLGAGAINFYIQNPSTSRFALVHRLTFESGTSTSLGFPELGLVMWLGFEAGSVPVTLIDYVATASFELSIDGPINTPIDRFAIDNVVSIAAATETLVFSARCDTTFLTLANHIPLQLGTISCSASGTKAVKYSLYRNCTIGGAPVYANPYPNLAPYSIDTAGTFSALGTGQRVLSINSGPNGEVLTEYNLLFQPGDIITLTATSVDVSVISCSMNVYF